MEWSAPVLLRPLAIRRHHGDFELKLHGAFVMNPELARAFRTHLGCTPQDYLRRVRLDLARQALRDGSAGTVTDAAIQNGFLNPGRFAAYYRDQYDENPGDTLSRTTTP